MPGFLTQALSMMSAISDSDITADKMSVAIQETGVPKEAIVSKVKKVSDVLSSAGGTRKRKGGRKSKKTRRH